MTKNPMIRVKHVLDEIAYLEGVSRSHTASTLAADPTVSRAAAYSLQNISEAVRNIPEHMLDHVSGIEWAKIKGFGNITRHEYFRVDPIILWQTISKDLIELRSAMNELLLKFDAS